MKFCFKKVCINAPFPTHQSGHIQQTYDVDVHKDDVYARLLGIKDNDTWFINVSCDLIDVYNDFKKEIEDKVREYYNNDNIHVVTSATHTHYSHEPHDPKYREFFINLVVKSITEMEYVEKDNVTTTFETVKCQKVGKSRISDYETNMELLSLLRFYSDDENFMNVVIHNCHPTILEATVPFFSAEYPGQLLRQLEAAHPESNFTFLQGCAGDISSRFVRNSKTYEEMLRLANEIYKDVEELMSHNPERKPLKCDFNEVTLNIEHDCSPIDLSKIRSDLSDRELETIGYGKIVRQQLLESGNLIKSTKIASLDLGAIKLVFTPNELFSDYLNQVDTNERMIVAYSNGQGPYMLPIDFPYITYELFTDTMSKKTKLEYIDILKTI